MLVVLKICFVIGLFQYRNLTGIFSSYQIHCLSVSGVFSTESPSAEPLTGVADNAESSTVDPERPSLPRSHSERLLAINRDFVIQERELREKYHDIIYNTAEKVMRMSQNNQKKALRVSHLFMF